MVGWLKFLASAHFWESLRVVQGVQAMNVLFEGLGKKPMTTWYKIEAKVETCPQSIRLSAILRYSYFPLIVNSVMLIHKISIPLRTAVFSRR